jgi:WD40 repeat protein
MNLDKGHRLLRFHKLAFHPHPYPYPINMGQYLLRKTIRRHYNPIDALAFSPDGSLFASAGDDGLVIIFQGNGSGKEIRRFQVKAPVTTLLWRSHFGNMLVAGDTSGDVHTICLNVSTKSTHVSVT